MKTKHLLIFQTLILLVFSNCKISDDNSPTRDFYNFAVDLELDPVKKEYLNGDLFWMSTNISGKEFTDESTGNSVKVGNGKFTFRVDVFDPFVEPDQTDKFSLSDQIGEVTEVDDFAESGSAFISFGCPSNSYSMQVGIQFLKPGGYLIYLNQDTPTPQVIFTEKDDCSIIPTNQIPPDNADIGSVSYTFNVDDTNKDVFETYATGFPDSTVDLAPILTALDNRQAFFVLVE
ncbi:MAG: hypothetical protein R2825_10350 [Saprospiraceae bacterium]